MALHPGNHRPGQSLAPLPQRTRERMAGRAFEAFTRVGGLRPSIMPEHLRRQLRVIGVRDDQLARVLGRMRSLSEWPYVWEAEGDARASDGDWPGAFAAWYVGQRILLSASPLKRRLYNLSLEAYEQIEQPSLERFIVEQPNGDRIAGYLQLPYGATPGVPQPCVLMLPGVTGTKEELHPYVMPLLRRGIAVARIDHPGYGETTGIVSSETVTNPRFVLEHLAEDPRLDRRRLHLHGMSLGANFALRSAAGSIAAGVTVICPPFRPERYFRQLPTLNLTALQHMTQRRDLDDLIDFAAENSLEAVAPRLTMPVRIFHGGRDRTIPVSDGLDLAAAVAGPVSLTVYERDHHNCLEHIDEITALTLEFFRDPELACRRHEDVERIDAAASIHVSDGDAERVADGALPRRARRIRLPFLLPGMRAGQDAATG